MFPQPIVTQILPTKVGGSGPSVFVLAGTTQIGRMNSVYSTGVDI